MQPLWKRILKAPELYLCVLIVAVVAFFCVDRIGTSDVRLAVGDEPFEQSSLPVTRKFQEPFKVAFRISNPFNHVFDLRIVPDDCATAIRVNGEDLDLTGRSGLCDFGNGFVLDHKELESLGVKHGSEIEVQVQNRGGDGGLNAIPESSSVALFSVLNFVLLISSGLLALTVARRFRINWGLALLLSLGVMLRVGFDLTLPRYDKYGHDVDGHVAYVHYVADNYSIPGAEDCWACYHPPVYYSMSVPAWKIANAAGVPGTSGLQVESILLSVAFLFLGFLFLRQFLSGGTLAISTALLSFWPVLILSAPRIGNDQLFYVFHALCLWGGIRYLNSGRGKFLVVAAVATVLSYWTKTTGAITMGVFVLFAVLGYFGNGKSLSATKSEVVSWIVFVLLVVGILVDRILSGAALVGNAQSLHSGLIVGNEVGNYVYFDMEKFLTSPYTSPWHDEMGRQYFWNYAVKTSLFGEFKLLETPAGKILATLVSISFLGLVATALRGFWKNRMKGIHWILLLQGIAFFVALAFLRVKHPYACSNDFRYIVPVLLSFIPFVGLGATVEGTSCKWKVLCGVSIAVFMLASVALMVNVALL